MRLKRTNGQGRKRQHWRRRDNPKECVRVSACTNKYVCSGKVTLSRSVWSVIKCNWSALKCRSRFRQMKCQVVNKPGLRRTQKQFAYYRAFPRAMGVIIPLELDAFDDGLKWQSKHLPQNRLERLRKAT